MPWRYTATDHVEPTEPAAWDWHRRNVAGGPVRYDGDLSAVGWTFEAPPPPTVAVAAQTRKFEIRTEMLAALAAEYPDDDGRMQFAEDLAAALGVQAYKTAGFTTPDWASLTAAERNLLDLVRARGIRKRDYLAELQARFDEIDGIVAGAGTDDQKRAAIAAVTWSVT